MLSIFCNHYYTKNFCEKKNGFGENIHKKTGDDKQDKAC